MTRLISALLACAGLCATLAQASPYTPADGSQIVETLARRQDPQLQQLRSRLAANPNDVALAIQLAQRYIDSARTLSDPRYLGYAQAALAPWWHLAAAPNPVRLLRATILQSTHRVDEALADLNAVLASEPSNAQAWLTRATVQTVRGDYSGASASCARLSNLASDLVSITCIGNVAVMTGRAAKGTQLLETTLTRSGQLEPGVQAWTLTLLAETAARLGQPQQAERHFQRALALMPQDAYLIGAYADFLLDQRRPAEALALVKDQTRIDGLLLRYALALKAIPRLDEALQAANIELADRFHAAALRGDSVHQREQARFELALRGDAKAALALAQKNWTVQKESADMRILLEAAIVAHDKAAAAPVLDWIRTSQVEDVALARLARQLNSGA